jgi:uncharacterized protein (TIGR03437 family)
MGTSSNLNSELRSLGAVRFMFRDQWDAMPSVSNVFFGPAHLTVLSTELERGPEGIFVGERFPAGSYMFAVRNAGRDLFFRGEIASGGTETVLVKQTPLVYRVLPSAGQVRTLSLAPGSLIALYGLGLASRTAQASSSPLPTSLAGTNVNVNNFTAPLIFVSDNQINAVLPSGISGLAKLTVRRTDGQVSLNVMVEPAVPAVFSLNGTGSGPASALNAITGALVSPSNPASPGDHVSVFATGLGETRSSGGLNVAVHTPEVVLGGISVPVDFAGRAPGFPGLDQINVRIPENTPKGLAVFVTIHSLGRASNTVSLAIR